MATNNVNYHSCQHYWWMSLVLSIILCLWHVSVSRFWYLTLLVLDDYISWCWPMGCFVRRRKYTCLCFGYSLCSCCRYYCRSEVTQSFKKFLPVFWFSFWLTTTLSFNEGDHKELVYIIIRRHRWIFLFDTNELNTCMYRFSNVRIMRIDLFKFILFFLFFPFVGCRL